ncbi:uncharacterized protein LOC124448102 [Xenia sp. Carnegie-2017]|uniref:uncharacterized protein LOC124448102 n=1 Tax=Xenia sp. Carnegie-2017 TaxID=2897299 RepID=UPI001F03B5A1|nr:uncharacterized protein LOC124448102 [Xenia sp. Carnegie-2017]
MNKYPIIVNLERFTSKNDLINTIKLALKNFEDDNVKKIVIHHFQWQPKHHLPKSQMSEKKINISEAQVHYFLGSIFVCYQCFVFCGILLNEVKALLSDEDKLTSEERGQLNNLKVDLNYLTKLLDKRCLYDYNFGGFKKEVRDVANDVDLVKVVKNIESTISNLNHPEVNDLFDLELTREDILCSVLGLKDEFGCRLFELSPHMREHRSEKENLLRFLKEFKEEDSIENLRDSKDVADILFKIGFTKHRSQFIAKWITSMPDPNHKPILSWVETYIENHFRYDILLKDQVFDFPFENDYRKKLFTVNFSRFDEEGRHSHPVNMTNFESPEDALHHVESKVAELNENDPELNKNNPQRKVYFHCTDHKSAVDILEIGIELGFGRDKLDFSDGEGFYMVNNAEFSLAHYGKTSTHPAIIMFDVSPQELSNFKGIDLSSAEKEEDWKLIVEYFRSGSHGIGNLPKNLLSHIRQWDYIRGPVSLNGFIEKNTLSQKIEQICIKKQELAKLIGHPSSILEVIFLKAPKIPKFNI